MKQTTENVAPFIVGVGRSGTTLLRLMLDAHPQIAIPSETHFLHTLIEQPPQSVDAFFNQVTHAQTWASFGLEEQAFYHYLQKQFVASSFNLSQAIQSFFEYYAASKGKPLWGDKTPPYVQYMPAIQKLIPQARFIHLIRDGRDVALSYQDKWFGPEQKDLPTLAKFWRDRILNARESVHELTPNTYLEVRYEDLVQSPEPTLRKICQFLNLDYSAEMLTYHQNSAQRLDEMQDWQHKGQSVAVSKQALLKIHEHTLKQPDQSQIGKWQKRWDKQQISGFEMHAEPLLKSLGYDLVSR
ncbi:sulfotransferase [Thiomicrorhabdus indica]|uniref:sulfotransferase family protein n=1 Tax=Thiomicrorhabdus indica TaxID=2267253 RepID=UPI002AA8C67D|nr:sulfotransferase [Thiomicrorhabdus indica]